MARERSAFSLPELVITMAVLAIGIVSAMQAFAFSVRVTGLVSDMVDAVFLVQDRMQDLDYKESARLIPGEVAGVPETAGKYTLQVKKDAPSRIGDISLYKVEALISWRKAARTEGFKVVTLYSHR